MMGSSAGRNSNSKIAKVMVNASLITNNNVNITDSEIIVNDIQNHVTFKAGNAEHVNKYTSKTDTFECEALLKVVNKKLTQVSLCLEFDRPLTLRTKLRFVANGNAHNAPDWFCERLGGDHVV